jgi:IclR family KDG regulon transcriptional repressor
MTVNKVLNDGFIKNEHFRVGGMKIKDNIQYINSLDRGLRILDMIAEKGYVGPTEVGDYLGINKSSAYRLLATIERRGYVEQDKVTKMYKLGTKLLELNGRVLANLDIANIAEPYLCELVDITGETAHLGILSKTRAVLISQKKGSAMVNVNTRVGMSEPAYVSAIGRAIISYLPEMELSVILDEIADEIGQSGDSLKKEDVLKHLNDIITTTRERGFAIDDEELFIGIRCIAVPIVDYRNHSVASVGISAPASRMARKNIHEYVRKVIETAEKISSRIGGNLMNVVRGEDS